MNEILGVQTRGFDRFPTRRKDFFSHFPSFRLGETSNWHNEYARPRSVERSSKGRSVLKRIQHFKIDALTQKTSPDSGY